MTVFWVVLLFSLVSGLFFADFLPWWNFAPVAFTAALTQGKHGGKCFLGGFIAVMVLWLSMAAYLDTLSESRLSLRVAAIFGLSSPVALMIVSALTGGLVGGLSAWSGWLLRRAFRSKRR